MKKVLILEGSPRRNGNSAILSDEFARGAEEAGCRVCCLYLLGPWQNRLHMDLEKCIMWGNTDFQRGE